MTKVKKENKELKTFSIHENNLSFVTHIKSLLFQYKHLENIINILLQQQFILNQQLKNTINEDKEKELIVGKEMFNLLLNPVIMKAVLNRNTGGIKTKEIIAKVNAYFQPSYPKAKKLSQVFHYSLPLESSKFSLRKSSKGLLGITLGKKIFYVYIGHTGIESKHYFKDKIINNVTISYSHGHIYYNFSYSIKKDNSIKIKDSILPTNRMLKIAGGDIGLNNLMSLFINDDDTTSLIISGKELISYNCNFNKKLANTNELISKQVKSYKTITSKVNNKEYQVPEVYTYEGKRLLKKKSQLFERRKLFMADYMNKIAKKIIIYLNYYKVTHLVLSKNLSFIKTDGSIKMNKKTKAMCNLGLEDF